VITVGTMRRSATLARRKAFLQRLEWARLGNPYAPPTTATFVPHASELPPDVRRFRLDRAATMALVRRSVLQRSAVILVTFTVLLGAYAAMGAPTVLTATWQLLQPSSP
jgi:hypothetical protein